MIMKIGLVDKEFAHIKNPTCYCGYDAPSLIEWDRETPERNEYVCFTERCYKAAGDPRFAKCVKIAWPLEPSPIHPAAYSSLMRGEMSLFDYVMTFDLYFAKDIKRRYGKDNIFWTPGGSWIRRHDWKIYNKTENVSIVASTKNWTEGHRLRQEVIDKFSRSFDLVCGYGRKRVVEHKVDIFKNYRFSVVIENCRIDDYWTDKLVDCFLCGTVPVFWGFKNVGEYFNPQGIIRFWNTEELGVILERILANPQAEYAKYEKFIGENFERAKRYAIVEDFMHEKLTEAFNNGKKLS
jgi:hypothetical protein